MRTLLPALGLIIASLSVPVEPAAAQGGMGGGMGGGRRGGTGGPGLGGGGRRSPSSTIKDNLKRNDPFDFLFDQKKALSLRDEQKDSLKALRKEMQHAQAPLFDAVESFFTSAMAQRGSGAPAGRGGMGGGSGRGGGRGSAPDGGSGAGAGMGAALPDTVRTLVNRLVDIQEAYRDRARTQLDERQRQAADSIMTDILAEERKKAEKERSKRRDRS